MNPELRVAVLLLLATEEIIKKRRFYEKACGYDENYGGDRVLLERIEQFLGSNDIKDLAADLRKEYTP